MVSEGPLYRWTASVCLSLKKEQQLETKFMELIYQTRVSLYTEKDGWRPGVGRSRSVYVYVSRVILQMLLFGLRC